MCPPPITSMKDCRFGESQKKLLAKVTGEMQPTSPDGFPERKQIRKLTSVEGSRRPPLLLQQALPAHAFILRDLKVSREHCKVALIITKPSKGPVHLFF